MGFDRQSLFKQQTEVSSSKNLPLVREQHGRDIEEIVYEEYSKQINGLNIKDTLKSYLQRTLQTILMAENDDRIFLLEVRKQLKRMQKQQNKQDYEEFIQLVDTLYLLAIDKALFYDYRKTMQPALVRQLPPSQRVQSEPQLQELPEPQLEMDIENEMGEAVHSEEEQQNPRQQGTSEPPNTRTNFIQAFQRFAHNLRARNQQQTQASSDSA